MLIEAVDYVRKSDDLWSRRIASISFLSTDADKDDSDCSVILVMGADIAHFR